MCEAGAWSERRLKSEIEDLRFRVKHLEGERDRIWDECQKAIESHRLLAQLANHLFPMVQQEKAASGQ